MFGRKLETAQSLVAYYESLFEAAGFDPSAAADGDANALKAFIDAKENKAAAGNEEILAAISTAGIELPENPSAEAVGAAISEALTAAEGIGEVGAKAAAERTVLSALEGAGIKAESVDSEKISAAIQKKVSADVAAKIAANGHKEPVETPPGGAPDTETKAGLEAAIAAESDWSKKAELYKQYSKKYLPALGS